MSDAKGMIRAASRTLSLLRTINELRSATLSDIARHEGIPLPTAYRFIQTLVQEGMVTRDPVNREYHPTALVKSLSSGFDDIAVAEAVEPILNQLTAKVGWPVFLSDRVGRRFVIRATTHPHTTLTFFDWRRGHSFPILGSTTGLAWLAYQSEESVRALVAWERAHDQALDIPEIDNLLRQLETVRRSGLASGPSRHERNGTTASLAIPICMKTHPGTILTLTYFAASLKPETAEARYSAMLRDTAEAIASVMTQ